MYLQLYEYYCHCGFVFKSPCLIGDVYGELLLRSEIDELVYLNALNSKEFCFFSKEMKKHSQIKNWEDTYRAYVVQDLFSLVCDLSPKKKLYFIGKHPNCPQCNSPYQMKDWKVISPPEIIDIKLEEVSFNEWNRLNEVEKKTLINKGLVYAIKKTEDYLQHIRDTPWLGVTPEERQEILRISREINENNFKMVLTEFRKLRGLNNH
jgi:hypothetical protein